MVMIGGYTHTTHHTLSGRYIWFYHKPSRRQTHTLVYRWACIVNRGDDGIAVDNSWAGVCMRVYVCIHTHAPRCVCVCMYVYTASTHTPGVVTCVNIC